MLKFVGLGFVLWSVLAASFGASTVAAQPASGGEVAAPRDNASAEIDAMMPAMIAKAERMGLRQPSGTPQGQINRAGALKLSAPLRMRPHSKRRLANTLSGGVDHDASSALRSYDCGVRTYNGHRGIDYSLGAYSWRTMDNQEVEIVAAAPGIVLDKADGNYDRECSWPVTSPPANYVVVHQDDGLFAMYWHMKSGSVTSIPAGSRVARGQYLGLVGSSGFSTGPHLHFELREDRGSGATRIDPYAGACNVAGSGNQAGTISMWRHQEEILNTEIIRLSTHTAPPPSTNPPAQNPPNNFCDVNGQPINPDPGYVDVIAPGSSLYAMVSLRDQRHDTIATMEIRRPDGTLHSTGISGAPSPPSSGSLGYYRTAYWYWGRTIASNEQLGLWKYKIAFGNRVAEHTFRVALAPQVPPPAAIRVLLDPQARSPQAGVPTTLTAFVQNTSSNAAEGCWLSPDYPLAASFHFQLLNPSNQLVGTRNENFSVPAKSTVKVRLILRGNMGKRARGVEIPMHVQCHNGQANIGAAVRPQIGFNILKLSFAPQLTPNVNVTTPIGPLGIAVMPGVVSTRTVNVTAKNIGAASVSQMVVRARKTGIVPLSISVCELNSANTCKAPFAATLNRVFAAGETVKFRLQLRSTGAIALNKVKRRVIVEVIHQGLARGATTFAVKTR